MRLPSRGPEVVGLNPTPATKTKLRGAVMLPFGFLADNLLTVNRITNGPIFIVNSAYISDFLENLHSRE
jgi:hypothetical protein